MVCSNERTNHCSALPSSRCWEWLLRSATRLPWTAKEKISKRALQEMIAGAKCASDHKAIADYYYAEAAKAQAKAVEHDEMAGWYRKAGEGVKKTPYAPGTIDHCERLVNELQVNSSRPDCPGQRARSHGKAVQVADAGM